MKDKDIEMDWAVIIDLLASQYGWNIEYITGLNLKQVVILIKQIKRRLDSQDGNSPQVNGENEEMSISDFETKLGGKKIVENGVTKIVL